MELIFLGTRGEIEIRSRRHRRHSAVLVKHGAARIMIDCGADWRGRLKTIAPTAVVLTHAHPDHASGLAGGAPAPVYATEETLELLRRFPILDRRPIRLRTAVTIDGVIFRAFPVHHSIRAPAVGYRVSAGSSARRPRRFAESISISETERVSPARWCGGGMPNSSVTLRLRPSWAGARRPASGGRSSPIAARKSCGATRGKLRQRSAGWVGIAASMRGLPATEIA